MLLGDCRRLRVCRAHVGDALLLLLFGHGARVPSLVRSKATALTVSQRGSGRMRRQEVPASSAASHSVESDRLSSP